MRLLLADEAQKRARDRMTFASWGTGLTADQYSVREQRLRLHPWAQSSMNSWLLCGDGHEVLSSCETFRMSSWSRGRKGWTQAVASVFTEPALRGRGYSSVLIEMLMGELARREMDLQASILFSDVGASLYERAGFEPLSASDWIFPVEAGPASKLAGELVAEGQVPGLWSKLSTPAAPFLVWPTPEQVDWHLERERTYSSLLARKRPSSCGARLGRAVILWVAKYTTDELFVIWLDAPTREQAEVLLQIARRTAHGAALAQVRWWECPLPFQLPEDFAGGRRVPRQGALPMLRAFQPEVRARDWTFISRAIWV